MLAWHGYFVTGTEHMGLQHMRIQPTVEHQRAKAERLRALHHPILVLPNAWDASSARIFEQAGFPALGTTSAGVALSLGYMDGQRASRDEMLEAVRRIAAAVEIPVTADMEAGFGDSIEEIVETMKGVIAAGAVGINIEDRPPGTGVLIEEARQAETIRAIREAASEAGVPLVINARTDVYLASVGEPESRFEHPVRRANAYRGAGADGLFVPGVSDADTIQKLAQAIRGPINILAGPGVPSAPELQKLGVARVSSGSGPMRATMALTRRIAQELKERGTFATFTEHAIPYAEANRLFEK